MIRPSRGTLAIALALGALGTWGWVLANGVVRRPVPKFERAVGEPRLREGRATGVAAGRERPAGTAAVAGASAPEPAPDVEPAIAIERLAMRLDRVAGAAAERTLDVDALLGAAPAAAPHAFPAGDELGDFLAEHPFEGTCVEDGLRLAAFGARLLPEGAELIAGCARLVRIDVGSIVIARGAEELRIAIGRAEARGP